MSPQPSNRTALVEGTLRCLETTAVNRITARVIAEESDANLASITYHFGSKDALVAEAIVTGLDRWLEEIFTRLETVDSDDPWTRFLGAAEAVEDSRQANSGLAQAFVTALSYAQHSETVRTLIADGVRKTRPEIARLLRFGDDEVGRDGGGLVLSMFYGLLFQALLDPGLAIDGSRLRQAMFRIIDSLDVDSEESSGSPA